ncbi:MAG: TfoX/Sxy family protein [Candidatus Peregrinibacteria bacterium]
MATNPSTIAYIGDQLSSLPNIRARKMFGEYALYCNEKVVTLACDDEVFVKITEAGKAFIGEEYEEGIAYPGAKPSFKIDSHIMENPEKFCELIRITEKNLPTPKHKKIR